VSLNSQLGPSLLSELKLGFGVCWSLAGSAPLKSISDEILSRVGPKMCCGIDNNCLCLTAGGEDDPRAFSLTMVLVVGTKAHLDNYLKSGRTTR
jgi:hypothetical protein